MTHFVAQGYKILCDEDGFDSAFASNNDSIVKFWRCLWKLNIPGKIKHFIWRACTNTFPIKTSLLKRKILMDAICPLCSKELESVVHALWSCKVIQVVWKKYFGWLNNGAASGCSFIDLLDKVKSQLHLLCPFAITAWKIWIRRNKFCVGDSVIPIDSVAESTWAYNLDYQLMFKQKTQASTTQHQVETT